MSYLSTSVGDPLVTPRPVDGVEKLVGLDRSIRFVAPGSVTQGRYGLFEYQLGPNVGGAAPHYHQTFSESFYVVSGSLTLYADGQWLATRPGDFVHVAEKGIHGFRNDADVATSFLILFAPGPAREKFFTELAEIRVSGRELSTEEWTEFYARHDQVNVAV